MFKEINRRHFIKATGALLPLPFLHSIASAKEVSSKLPFKRAVFINLGYGLMPDKFFPSTVGKNYKMPEYLQSLETVRDKFTVFSGLSHDGLYNHTDVQGFLTGYERGNSVSIDQLISKKLGTTCRMKSLMVAPFDKSGGPDSGVELAYNQQGVVIPPLAGPKNLYMKLFSDNSAKQKEILLQNLKLTKSLLDDIQSERNSLKRSVNYSDKQLIEEYYQTIRETEQGLARSIKWIDTPKPKAPFKFKDAPEGVWDLAALSEYLALESDLMYLALKTDTTRVIAAHYAVSDRPLAIDGASTNHHLTYSHHNNNADKIKTLAKIEKAQFENLVAKLILKLSQKDQNGQSLLDDTMVMSGSNLGNPPNHIGKNLPILVAGGGFEQQHGQHISYRTKISNGGQSLGFEKGEKGRVEYLGDKNEPLCNLYLSMMHKLGIEQDSFGISTGTLKGINS